MGQDKIEIRVSGMATTPWRELRDIQGDLKTLTTNDFLRLKASIKKHGFAFPFFVWIGPGGIYTIDGHSRKMALESLVSEKVSVPDELPAVFIEAEDMREAKKLLLLLNSRYGKISEEGLYEFTEAFQEADPEFFKEYIDLPEIDLKKYINGYGPEEISENPVHGPPSNDGQEDSGSVSEKITKCPGCGYDLGGLI